MPYRTLTYTVSYKLGGVWTAATKILRISGSMTASTNADNPLAFGDGAGVSCSIDVMRDALPSPWYHTPVKVDMAVSTDGGAAVGNTIFNGVITSRESDGPITTLTCADYSTLVRAQKLYSPMFLRRPAATATGAATVENPDDASYAGGIINYILWQAGGRPYQQSATYPDADFYYLCDQAPFAPPYAWLAGDDAWQEAQKLCQASGGQLYQDARGVMRYVQPLAFSQPVTSLTLNESVYGKLRETITTAQSAGRVTVPYTPRMVQSMQFVIEDETPRLLKPGETIYFDLEPKWPVVQWGAFNAYATTFTGGVVPYDHTSGVTWGYAFAAQKCQVQMTNHRTNESIVVNRIEVKGRPLVAGEAATVTVGSGDPEIVKTDNEYIQDEAYARRFATMTLAFYGTARAVYTADGCPFEATRMIGDVVPLSSTDYGLSSVPCLITSADHDDTGGTKSYQLVPVADLPTLNNTFIWGHNYASADSRALGY